MRFLRTYHLGQVRRTTVLVGTALLVGIASACGGILDVELPGRIPAAALDDPALARTLAASVVADAECAFNNYATGAALLSDQFLGASGGLDADQWGRKSVPGFSYTNDCPGYGSYNRLHIARFQSSDILARLGQWTDAQAGAPVAPLKARVATYGAYAYVFLGEGYCQMRLDTSSRLFTPTEVLTLAETKFTEAIGLAQAAGSASNDVLALARLGRARVRLDLGKKAEAVADASLIPEGWEWFLSRDLNAPSRWNGLWLTLTEGANASVAPQFRALTVGATADPRVVVKFGPESGFNLSGTAFDGRTPLYVVTNKNASRSAPERLASYVEAQLIEAEARGGTAAIAIINARRAQLDVPDYDGPTDPASVTALILDERNREFFMEGGHRLNDLLRYRIPWKIGNDQNDIPYGHTTCLPLPREEVPTGS